MKNKNIVLFILLLVLGALACKAELPQTSAPTQSVIISTLELPQGNNNLPQTEDEVPRVTVEEARDALNGGLAVIVDVRNADSYAASHVDGALSIPLIEFEDNIANVPFDKDQWIITYCT